MVVQSSEGGGADAAGEFLTGSELELKKEKEMCGEFEHIACRGGDDYDSNETEGSFVMVKSGADSDARSDSSEREIELDVGGGVADRPGAVGALPLVTPVNDERVGEWKMESEEGREGKDVESSSSEIGEKRKEMDGGDQVQTAEIMHAVGEVVNSTRSGRELKEEDDVVGGVLKNVEEQEQNDVLASEDTKGGRDTAIEDLSEADSVADVYVLNNKEQHGLEEEVMAVEDSKRGDEDVSEDLDDQNEAVSGIIEGISEGISCEGAIMAASSPVTSADDTKADRGLESVLEGSEVVESSVTRPSSNNVEAVSGIEERKKVNDVSMEDTEFPVNREREVDSAPEIMERGVSADEVANEITTSVTEHGKKEVNSTSDFEERTINDEESVIAELSITEHLERGFDSYTMIEGEDTKDEGSKDTESSITDHEEQVGKTADENITTVVMRRMKANLQFRMMKNRRAKF